MKDLIDREVVLEELSCTRPSPKDRPKYLQWLADNKAILEVPLVQSDCDEWCTDCKEYDVDNHCCPRFNKVIREALKEAQPERKKANWEKDEHYGEDKTGTDHCEADAVRMAIKALEEQPHWIPCSERLPEAEYGESDNVLTTCIYKDAVDGYRSVKTLYYNGGVWCYPTGETFEGKVLAWMPLPKPYGGENE